MSKERPEQQTECGIPLCGRNRALPMAYIPAALTAVAAVFMVVVASACGTSQRKSIHLPDVTGKPLYESVATLQNLGFKTHTQPKADPSITPGTVISTDPAAGVSADAGSNVEVYVSSGAG
jgi:eukaryotic-like serine/threonine-protein kinase